MKKTMITCALLLVVGLAQAQLTPENSKFLGNAVSDSTVAIEKIYVGFLPQLGFSMDQETLGEETFDAGFRAGGEMSWSPIKHFSVHAWSMYEKNTAGDLVLGEVFAEHANRGLSIKAGYMATPSTLMRPHPLSGDGQFETATAAQLPEGALGGSVTQSMEFERQYCDVSVGMFLRENKPEYHFTITGGNKEVFNISETIYYRDYDKALGLSFKITAYMTADLKLDVMWTSESPDPEMNDFEDTKSNYIFGAVSFGSNYSNTFYCDFGQRDVYPTHNIEVYETETSRFEIGYLKSFTGKNVKGLMGGGWRNENHSIMFYTMIYL